MIDDERARFNDPDTVLGAIPVRMDGEDDSGGTKPPAPPVPPTPKPPPKEESTE